MNTRQGLLERLWRIPEVTLVLMVRFYQRAISPLLPASCRYQPTCSEYMIGAIRKHGAIKGSLRGIGRILRCHPFSPGGFDPP